MNISNKQSRLTSPIRRVSHLTAGKLGKRSTIVISLVLVVLVTLMNQEPVSVQAQTPVDLKLGGEGAASWNIDTIAPGDSGIKMVTLRNAGEKDRTASAKSIHIDRLQAGETVTLGWEWGFPLTGENQNLAQGIASHLR